MGDLDDRSGVCRMFDDDIDPAFAESPFETTQEADLSKKQLVRGRRVGSDQEVDVAAALAIVDAGAEQPDLGPGTE
jgi:hypothetical protein